MTNDTKRALDIIRPMASEFGIYVDADNKFLYVDGQAIGISGNSTYATLKEFIGYMIIKYDREYRNLDLGCDQLDKIRRYWYSAEQVAQIMEKNNG